MKSSVLPNITEPENFKEFIKYRKGELRESLLKIQKKIPYYYRHYDAHNTNVHQIQPNKLSTGEREKIIYAYESYTSKAIISYRDILFEHILICPYCGLNETEHLDHYLPKSEFSEYSLFTTNLIPCCSKCNSKYKKTGYVEDGTRVYLHPYIDKINDHEILKANIRWTNNAIILNYGINQRCGISQDLVDVMKKHFKHLKLGNRYLKYATKYITDMKPIFTDAYGVSADSESLEASIASKYNDALAEYGQNHWKTAILKSLRNNENFCNGGLLNI
ncbi:MAG: HNH endonuclease [Gammaproteobacteria bacterium]|nr:HNH endonuclease [Gammaproteobacteria bacterium]MBU2239565.1 HNH endonuclease [Gammaproteobacteria bacterium]MBU2411326.1 HNH endonuclease [Gammaproteobacteria bacterium]